MIDGSVKRKSPGKPGDQNNPKNLILNIIYCPGDYLN